MPDQNRRLEARTPDRAEAAQPDVGRDRVGIPAQVGSAQSIVLLRQQACAELFALRSTLASQGDVGGAVPRQLTSLARTIARIGSTAQRLESEVAQVRHHAYHDALTGLPNRGLLLDRFDRALAQAARRDGHVAVLMFDLDDFKLVNDRFGHRVGDQLLQGVARRLEGATRDADTVCRYGGDEFVILLPEVDARQGAVAVAQKVQASLSRPFLVNGYSIMVGASIGIAVYPMDGIAPSHLLQRADVAMYGAKDDPTRRHLSQACERPPGGSAGQRARRWR
jgi:diguanylate cyclase (GGDEF)-like protein